MPRAHGRYTQFTEVEPLPWARIYIIDTTDGLNRLVRVAMRYEWYINPGQAMRDRTM